MSADSEPGAKFDVMPVLAWMTDAQGRCLYANTHAAAYFPVGKDIASSPWSMLIHPEDRACILARAVEERSRQQTYQAEYRILTEEGEIRWKLETASPRHSDTGEFLGYVASIADITGHHIECNALVASEATHRFLTENSMDLISRFDPEGVILYVTPSLFEALGYAPAEVIGTNAFEHIHPDDAVLIRERIAAQCKQGSGTIRMETRKRHKNGHYLWLASTFNVLLDSESGELTGVVAVCRDISAERQTKDELKRRKERFRGLVNLSSDWYWETDELGRFIFVSDSVERVFGIPPEKLLGRVCIDFALEKDKPELDEYFSKVSRQEAFRDIRYSAYVRSRDAICHASISGEPILEDGVFSGYRGVGRDITQEITAAKELDALAAENNALIENSLDMMTIIDREGLIMRVNRSAAETLGYTKEELIGRSYISLVHPDDREGVLAADLGLRTGTHTIHDFENRCVCKDGRILHMSWSARWMEDKQIMYATGRDTTERHATRVELQKSKDQLTTMLESIGDAFFALDNEWRVTYVNEKTAHFVGRKKEDLIGKIVWEAVPEFQSSSVLPYYKKAMETRDRIFFEGFWEPTQSWADIRIYPNDDGLAVFFHDITARRESENVVRASEQRLR
ncbi:MAG: PAS domain-containing protein, partial [Burkholderiaceae bacterium]